MLVASTGFVVNVSLFRTPGYAINEFAPVTELGASPNVILARPDSGIDSIATLIARAKATARKLDMTNPGLGSTPHLTVELLQIRAGVEFVQVPHNSAGLAIQSLLAGTTQVGCTALPPAHAAHQVRRAQGLALTSEARWPDLPDVPTMAELGWSRLRLGDLPGNVRARRRRRRRSSIGSPATTVAALNAPETKARLLAAGFAVRAAGPEASGAARRGGGAALARRDREGEDRAAMKDRGTPPACRARFGAPRRNAAKAKGRGGGPPRV